MYCSTCGDERRFERTPCLDGHGPDCPERACVECGAAVFVGPDATLGDDGTALSGDSSASAAPGSDPSETSGSAASTPSAPPSMPSDPASGGPDRTAPATVRAVA